MKKVKHGPYSVENKDCIICLIALTIENTRSGDIARANYICKSCHKKRDQQKYINRKEIIREQQRKYEINIKMKIIEEYGGKCACCNENTPEFLTIDHINNNGAKERELTKQGSGGKIYRWLIKNGYPKDNYQLLCYNCNCAKGFCGVCPHKKEV
jgi:hypothetical protein